MNHPEVDIRRLRGALFWYARNCFQWLEATRDHGDFTVPSKLGAKLESLLAAYKASLRGATAGVPKEILAAATPLQDSHLTGADPGPKDATPAGEEDQPDVADISCAILDTTCDEMTPFHCWN